jgi:hypothetical protein
MPKRSRLGLNSSLTFSMVLLIWTMESSSKYPGETTTIILSEAVKAFSVSQPIDGGQSIRM